MGKLMFGNAKFRWFLLAPILLEIFVVVNSPVGSWAGELEEKQERVRQNPDDAEAHFNLGIAYYMLGKYQDAITSYKEAIRIKPDYARWHIDLGHSYVGIGKYQDAIASYKEAIRIDPDYGKAHMFLGTVYDKLGKHQDAINSYKEATRIKPDDAIAHINLGSSYDYLGRNQEAIASYKEAIRAEPDDTSAHNNLGRTYRAAGQYQDAITSYKEAIRINPDHANTHNNLGSTYHELGRNQEAIGEYREALRIDPNDTYARNNLNDLEQKIADKRLVHEQRLLEEERKKHKARKNIKEADRLAQERRLLEEERKKWEVRRIEEENRQQQALQHQPAPGGTGFLFSSRDYIITNYHVVKGASSIEVKFPNGEIIKARLQAKDSQNDIAVLKLAQSPSSQIPDLKFGDSSKVRPGDRVFTIGYPASSILGKNQKITDGIISSVTGIEDDPTMFQITVPIQPGNSGGPLFNERGEVIGITTASLSLNAIQSMGAIPQNVNYAIKSSFVNNLLTTIPKTLLSNRGIVVVPNKPGNSLSDFFERVSNNIVLIEAKD